MTKNNRFLPAFEKGHFSYYIKPSFRPHPARYASRFTRYELCLLYKQILPRTPGRQIRALPTYKVGPRNLRNPCLIKDLRLFKELYTCRDSSTDDERTLQIHLFVQNKANFRKSQMNVSKLLVMDYDKMDTWSSGKNKPKTKPIQSQFKPNTNPIQSQYKPNSKPIQTQSKPIQIQNLSAISVAG